MFFPWESLTSPEVVPGHVPGIVCSISGDVGPLLSPGNISFGSLLCWSSLVIASVSSLIQPEPLTEYRRPLHGLARSQNRYSPSTAS